jgi:hypothetical protein
MDQDLELTAALLARTPATLNALLRALPAAWTHANEGEGTWNPYSIVGHLLHGERTDWMPRARMILDSGETKAFSRFDRLAQERESQGKSLEGLLDEFARERASNLDQLRELHLTPADLARSGLHPTLGSVTLSQLLATWAAHDMTHLHQLSRVLAYQYKAAVGPWSAFLGVMQCAGHSD